MDHSRILCSLRILSHDINEEDVRTNKQGRVYREASTIKTNVEVVKIN